MAVEIKIPSPGESITEVTLGQWLKKDGDYVEKDETVAEIESDKVNLELTAPEAGVLRTSIAEGETAAVGAIAGTIEASEKPASSNGAPARNAEAPAAAAVAPVAAATAEASPKASSVAKKVAAEHGVSLAQVEGHGTGGRITKDDVLAVVESRKATPATAPAPAGKSAAPVAGSRGERREKMSQLRKRIATRLVEAQHTAAILTTFNEVDMSALMDLRARYKESFQKKHGIGIGFMSFFVKASIEALKAFPRVNAYIENDEIVYHDYYDIGVAVGTEKGLVVPILRNAETLNFAGIENTIKGYAEKAKTGKLTLDDLSGGTFTISNGGVYGSMMSTPILNPPQSAILGMHNIIKRPIAVGDEIKIRPMMYLALSYDHRIIDGKEAVGFLVRIKECIEAPERMFLDV